MKPKGAKHRRARGMWQVPPFAAKLTRRHREAARADETYERALREQTLYPQRIDALIAGQTWYCGKPCERCDSVKRRVYNNSCWTCQKARTGFALDARNRCVSLGSRTQSRGGYLARLDARRREISGEYIEHCSGECVAREYPTGRLDVRFPPAHTDSRDFRAVSPERIFALCERHPDLLAVLRMAGWSL